MKRSALLVLAGVSAVLSIGYAVAAYWTLTRGIPVDWFVFVHAGETVGGGLYADDTIYRWSPLFAYVMVPLASIGALGWTVLHFAALALLPRRLALLALIAAPFWFDVWVGNILTFVFVAAALGLMGSRWGALAFLGIALIAPRPLMLPLVAWFLWTMPGVRVPFVGMAAASLVLAFGTGYLDDWVVRLASSTSEMVAGYNLSPSKYLGLVWMPVGSALALIALAKGRPGLASFLFSPYWLFQYALIPLADVGRGRTAALDATV